MFNKYYLEHQQECHLRIKNLLHLISTVNNRLFTYLGKIHFHVEMYTSSYPHIFNARTLIEIQCSLQEQQALKLLLYPFLVL